MGVLLISLIIGVVVGVLSGMLGVGGGMVMIPVFRLGYGMAAIQATATSLFAIVPISIAGMVTHVRNKTCYPKLGAAAGIGGALVSPIGVRLANISPSWAVMLAAAGVIGYASITMLRKALALPKGEEQARERASVNPNDSAGGSMKADADSTADAVPAAHPADIVFTPRMLAIGVAIGMVAGFASGYVGVGGGFIMVPMFITLFGTTMKKTSGTSLFAICILAVPGVIGQLMLGNVMVGAGVAMAAGAIPGAILGANLMRRLPERLLRFIFSAMLGFAAIMLVLKEFGF